MATIQQKIAGLYIAFFNRAADKEGLDYWESQASLLGEIVAIKELASGFALHPKFTDLYSGLSNQEFVDTIYKNTLGKAGDSEGIAYWTNQLNSGMSKSDMVADFISISLDFDPNAPQYSSLSEEDIATAMQRKALITNKSNLSLDYVNLLSNKTNLDPKTDPSNSASLDSDPSFQASIKVVSSITDDKATVDSVEGGIELLKDRDDAISIVNSLSTINRDSVSKEIEAIDSNTHHSYTNYGLGTLSSSSSEGVSSLDSSAHWNKSEITYSFNHSIPDSYNSYPNEALTNNWTELNQAQKNTVEAITADINNLLNIKLTEVADDGDIRFNIVNMEENTAGFSFYPSTNPDYGGDVFLSQSFNTNPKEYGLTKGKGGWITITHELGHALGLKHPFEEPNKLPTQSDDMNHTVMSYTTKEDIIPNFIVSGNTIKLEYNILYPSFYSLYDVSALQSIYGVNSSYHTEDNIYTTQYSNYEIQTIWDAGGKDSIDLSLTKGDTTLDMRGGTLNSVDVYSLEDIISLQQEGITNRDAKEWIKDKITELYNNDNLYTGENNFAIAEGVIIENITTGSGDDTIRDNMVDNIISTGLGDDKIYIGAGGYDHINGGEGSDNLYINLLQEQVTIEQIDKETYNIIADSFEAEIIGVERVYFTDNSFVDL